jgi:5-methylcytosine-specific restriction endonuclease McrA
MRAMNQSCGKATPLRLGIGNYAKLREQVLQRDSWRCQFCGSMRNLEVHHQQFRSRSGEDKEENLITLCTNCHSSIHI